MLIIFLVNKKIIKVGTSMKKYTINLYADAFSSFVSEIGYDFRPYLYGSCTTLQCNTVNTFLYERRDQLKKTFTNHTKKSYFIGFIMRKN